MTLLARFLLVLPVLACGLAAQPSMLEPAHAPLGLQKRGGSGGPGAGRGAGAGGRGAASAGAPGGRSAKDPDEPNRERLPKPDFELGQYPTLYPQVLDVRAELGFAHQDATGGCEQTCLAVSGAHEGGFAAVFQDERKGNIGLYLARLDGAGARIEEQLPISDQVGTARELFPRVAAAPDGAGAVAWLKMAGSSQATLRFYAGDREAWSGMKPLQSVAYDQRVRQEVRRGVSSRNARGPEAMAERESPTMPDVVRAQDGRVIAVWQEGGKILMKPYRDGEPERPTMALNLDAAQALNPPRAAVDALGRILVAWDSEKGVAASFTWDRSLEVGEGREVRPGVRPAGPGKLRDLGVDPRGGFWLLVEHEQQLLLRHLSEEARRDREDQPLGSIPRTADLATWERGLVVLTEEVQGRQERRIVLRFFGSLGRPADVDSLEFPSSPRGSGAFLAGEGPSPERLLVVWNDDRERNSDVFYAFLEPGAEGPVLGEERRWNDDEASSYQMHASIASTGDRALLAWDDERASGGHIYLRHIGADGAWLGDERAVEDGPTDRDRTQRRPAAALNADGRHLVTWVESVGRAQPFRLRAQAFGADGEPLGEAFDVDPGYAAPGGSAPAAVALDENRGYVLAWVREDVGPVTRRVSLSGEFETEPWRLSDRVVQKAKEIELCLLGPGGLVCVWDELSAEGGKARVLTGRLLGPDALPVQDELRFPWSGEGGDLDAELCATGDGGFLMAWTGRDGPPRDVIARFFGPDGAPSGMPLGISTIRNEQDFCDVARLTDGSFVVIWEDDLSGIDHAVARRIKPDRASVGPIVMVDPKVGKHIEVRHAPRIAALGDGFVSAWNDHGASRGVDVVARVVGPAFDAGLPPNAEPMEESELGPEDETDAEAEELGRGPAQGRRGR